MRCSNNDKGKSLNHIKEASVLTPNEIEEVEKLSLRWMYQAVLDFGFTAWDIFRQSPDEVKDVAEDITRELLDSFSTYHINQRIFGNVDYRKACYVLLPSQTIRQALFVDSKAEKDNSSGTMQMSQLSLRVRQIAMGNTVDEPGMLNPVSTYGGLNFLTTTMLLHYHYEDTATGSHRLKEVTLAAVPNGNLQAKYNPTITDGIWNVGRHAPSRGEDFRVRLSFTKLTQKAAWRVQRVRYNEHDRRVEAEWIQ